MDNAAIVPAAREGEWARARQPRDLWTVLSVPLLAFLALPLVALLLRTSPGSVALNLGQPAVQDAIGLSLGSSLAATGVTLLFGTPVAYVLARRRFPLKRLVDALIDLPTVLPPAVAGVALLMAFGRRGLLGGPLQAWGVSIAFTQAAVVMAQTFIAAPFYLRAASLGFAGVDRELELAAALDGAGGWAAFRHVTLPLSWQALVSGAAMTWARALGEFGATIIFAGNFPGRTQTMPLAIYVGFEIDLDVALTLSAILIGCSCLALVAIKVLLQRE